MLLEERIDAHRRLCVSDLSPETVNDELGDKFEAKGLFLYVLDDRPIIGGIRILARVASYDAAIEVLDLFASAFRATPIARKRRPRRQSADMSVAYP